jgi:hypothetical protein
MSAGALAKADRSMRTPIGLDRIILPKSSFVGFSSADFGGGESFDLSA